VKVSITQLQSVTAYIETK